MQRLALHKGYMGIGGPSIVFVGLRFNIAYADNTNETLYQELTFDQKDMMEKFSLDTADH